MKFKQNLVILSAILIAVLILVIGCQPVTPPIEVNVPSNGSISIAHGAAATNDATPPLTLSATGATYMAFSGDGTTWSSWITYATSYSLFNITTGAGCTSGDGTKKVYVKFKNDVGESTKIYDSIVLDTVAPKLSSAVYTDVDISGTVNNGDKITFTFDDEMLTSTVTSTNVTTSLPLSAGIYGIGPTVIWNITGTVCTVTLGTSPTIVSGTTVNPSLSVTDIAGNADNSSAVTIITIPVVTPPTPPTPTVDPAKLFVSLQTGKAKYTTLPAGATSVTVYSDATKDPVAAVTGGVTATIILNDWWTAIAGVAANEYIYFMITYSDGTTSPVTYDGQLPALPDPAALAKIQATNKNTVTSSTAGNVDATDKISLYVVAVRYSEPTPLGTMTTAKNLADTNVPLYTRTNVNGHESATSGADGIIVQITGAVYAGGAVDGKVETGDTITITYSGNVTVTAASISFVLGGTTITADLAQGAVNTAVLTITGGPYDLSAQATVNFNLANENIVDAAGGGNWAFEKDSDIVWTPSTHF
jgi:hypothetical protein